MSLSEDIARLEQCSAKQADTIAAQRGELNNLRSKNDIARRQIDNLRSDLHDALHRYEALHVAHHKISEHLNRVAEENVNGIKNRSWIITTWLNAQGFTDGTPHDNITVNGGCVRELLEGLAAVDQGEFEQWRRKVTGQDDQRAYSNVDAQTVVDDPNAPPKDTSATVGTASDGIRTSHIEGENNTHGDPIAVLFSVLAQVLQSSDLVSQRQKIRFEFIKD